MFYIRLLLSTLFLVICLFLDRNSCLPLQYTDEEGRFSKDEVEIKRFKRQDPGDQFIDNIFQIPISTLNAVNDLIKSTRPMIQRARERIQQQYNAWQQSQQQSSAQPQPKPNKNKDKITKRFSKQQHFIK